MTYTDFEFAEPQCSANCPYWYQLFTYRRPDGTYGRGVVMRGPGGAESDLNGASDPEALAQVLEGRT